MAAALLLRRGLASVAGHTSAFPGQRAPELVRAAGLQLRSADDAAVFRDALSAQEHDLLVHELLHNAPDPALARWRRRRYESDHWDSVITGYKELERPLSQWSEAAQALIRRTRAAVEQHLRAHAAPLAGRPQAAPLEWLAPHVIELGEQGLIKAHVDSVKFSGIVVAGLSLLSQRVMRLEAARDDDVYDGSAPRGECPLKLPIESLPRSLVRCSR
jgi:hypothetical protein